jgi:hypothetical protein
MLLKYSAKLRDDAHCTVQAALQAHGIVNLFRVAEEVRLRNLAENIAREDIEELVLYVTQLYGAAVEFDEQALTSLDLPDSSGRDSRNDLEKALSERIMPDARFDLLHLDPEG